METKEQIYDPTDIFEVLADPGATPEDIVELLLKQITPFLPYPNFEVYSGIYKTPVSHILEIYDKLQRRYRKILENYGRAYILQGDEDCLDVTNITRKLVDDQIYLAKHPAEAYIQNSEINQRLLEVRRCSNPDFLECLMMLDDRFTPDQTFDDDVDDKFLAETDEEKSQIFLTRVDQDFSACIRRACDALEKIRKKTLPEGLTGQPYAMIIDTATQSFASLLSTILDKNLSVRKRFEALRLLEWAIAFFSISVNPIFQIQCAAREEINDKLGVSALEADDDFSFIVIPQSLLDRIKRDELNKKAKAASNGDIQLVAHTVRDKVKKILSEDKKVLLSTDRIIFESREKSAESVIIKIMLNREIMRCCQACLAGLKTPGLKDKTKAMSKEEAQKKINDYRKQQQEFGKFDHKNEDDPDLFELQPINFSTLDDQIGCSIVIPFNKLLEEFTEEERKKTNASLKTLAALLIDYLGLDPLDLGTTRIENRLWEGNSDNIKSSKKFRVFKLHGTFMAGDRCRGFFDVPIEIQLLPLESYIRKNLPGSDTSVESYDLKKAKELKAVVFPEKIKGLSVFPPVRVEKTS